VAIGLGQGLTTTGCGSARRGGKVVMIWSDLTPPVYVIIMSVCQCLNGLIV
jgi:hypothetical protein